MAPAAKFKRALKSAARLPVRAVYSRSNVFAPLPNETPLVILRVQVLGCSNLIAKDKGLTSDPFVVVSVFNSRHHTPVVKRSLNPTYAAKDATFDFPIYASLSEKLGAIELVVWDKDLVSKEYLGEVALLLEDWFVDGRSFGFDDVDNKPFSVNLKSTHGNTPATGSIHVKLGFVAHPHSTPSFGKIFTDLVKHSRPSLVSAPPTEGVGTIRSRTGSGPPNVKSMFEEHVGNFSDDSDDSDGDDDQFSDALEGPEGLIRTQEPESMSQPLPTPPHLKLQTPSTGNSTQSNVEPASPATKTTHLSKIFTLPIHLHRRKGNYLSTSPPKLNPFSQSASSTPISASDTFLGDLANIPAENDKKRLLRGKFRRSLGPGSVPSTPSSGTTNSLPSYDTFQNFEETDMEKQQKVPRYIGKRRKGERSYSFDASKDMILGIVMLEIQRVEDLPKFKNVTRLGWDMDPFVVCSFGKKVFRTRVIRHSLNPVFEEKLLFQVRRYESSFRVQFSVHDWDKLSKNDHIGDAGFELSELIAKAPQKVEETGMYDASEDGSHGMIEYNLKLESKEDQWDSKHSPVISLRAKFQPYDLLRQRFWRQYLKQYDTDDSGRISHVELSAMLDSLGSTLTRETVNGFWAHWGKKPDVDELTMEEMIWCLEDELFTPDSERRHVEDGNICSAPTPALEDGSKQVLDLEHLDFSAKNHAMVFDAPASETPLGAIPPSATSSSGPGSGYSSDDAAEVVVGDGSCTISSANAPETPLTVKATDPDAASAPVPAAKGKSHFKRLKVPRSKDASTGTTSSGSGSQFSGGSDDSVERIITVKTCPLCHKPRTNSRAEKDLVTHLAVCASKDWNKVDRIMVGNFVTASQAQRKWYSKIITKISSGDYRLGANSANIIVQNRITGQLEEEKMQVYVRLGIRLLYKGATGRMEGARARHLLKSLSIKQGVKFDSPESAHDIPSFIDFYDLNMDEVLEPIESYKSFNQFFYRKLKASARPIDKPTDPYRLVSAADCRLMTFETVDEATRLWIKGREFTIARLLGPRYKDQVENYNGGALAIFRLAPQDYHRFHSPVDGCIGEVTEISGEYYTVNPQAIRSSLDVYGENVRTIVPIDSPQFRRVMAVCVGAMMVGSIKITVAEGDNVGRGEEFGYFAFGGSTIVTLFEKGTVKWDEDLLINGGASLETLVRVGMGIGTGRGLSST